MFFINEGNNLDKKEESFLDKFQFLDILPRNTQIPPINEI